ncbi:MAG: pantoate--beta-alanine ligase [Magnetococcales bacterium]|nr:pantoate--beta-alanine ligase [Magnetococcales bacterium]NGZ25696.1 pantoate--beta-alanine ligase [Magnetococcales bacterium]
MELLTSRQLVQAWTRLNRQQGRTIGFVPTMGALHEGHLSLVRRAVAENDLVVASIFVNPTQFGPNEDFNRYPREPERDAQMLQQAGCHALFLPQVEDIYPAGSSTRVTVSDVTEQLCGLFRPGHFQGVATVVAILFNLVMPTRAYFGKKDYQQWVVIRRMVTDLAMDLEIIGMETVRESDGMALSSRNRYLTPQQRQQALAISRGLRAALAAYQSGCREGHELVGLVMKTLEQAGIDRVDYAALHQIDSLAPAVRADAPSVLLVAAHVGGVRLIDNLELTTP